MSNRLIYVTVYDFDNGEFSGVVKKILQQIKVFEQNGYETDFFFSRSEFKRVYFHSSQEEIIIGHSKGIKGIDYWSCIKKYLKDKIYDCAYIRNPGRIDPWVLSVLKLLYKKGIKIIYEFPTYPYDNEYGSYNLDYIIDKIFRRFLKKYVKRIVTFSKDDEIFKVQTIKCVNGIDVNGTKPILKAKTSNNINLLGVAWMTPTHGYERVIKGVALYKQKGGERIIIHLVGEGKEKEKYLQLTKELQVENEVKFYPFLCGEKLDNMYEMADFALIDFGAYKDNLSVTSALKSRECLAKGLPLITGCPIDVAIEHPIQYILEYPNDQSDIDFFQVECFYDKFIQSSGKLEIAKQLRDYALKYVDMSITMKPVIKYLAEEKEMK